MGKPAQIAQQLPTQAGVVDALGFAHHRAHPQQHFAPGLAALVPAVVTGVVAKAEENRQRQAEQGERCRVDLGEVARHKDFNQHNHRRQQRQHQGAHGNAFGDRTSEGEEHGELIGSRSDDHLAVPVARRISRRSCS
jgi:hypothetical protein